MGHAAEGASGFLQVPKAGNSRAVCGKDRAKQLLELELRRFCLRLPENAGLFSLREP